MRIAHVAPTFRSQISAAWRIRQAQESLGADAFAMVHIGQADRNVKLFGSSLEGATYQKRSDLIIESLPLKACRNRRMDLTWSSGWSGFPVSTRINEERADIVNFHWLSNGMAALSDLHRINAPLVFTLHDVWALTAGCHCNLGCDLWKEGCTPCPQLGNDFISKNISRILWKRKYASIRKISKLGIVSPSDWLASMAQKSPILQGSLIRTIPNCVNLDIFRPQPKEKARRGLGLPLDKKMILFGAVNATGSFHKGYDLLIETLDKIKDFGATDYHLLVFGASSSTLPLPIPATFLGDINEESKLALAYQSADVFVAPSRQDNFPSTVVEASACGIPTVSFRIGGIPEIVKHLERGYIASPFDTTELAKGIRWVIDDAAGPELSGRIRAFAERQLAPKRVAQQYLEFYRELLDTKSHGLQK
jgi:glycosyltransferase involved in cell wall biosynthesis